MDTLADYESWKATQQQNNVEAANVVLGGVEGKPDEVAGDLNLASEFGKTTGNPVPPAPMVAEYRGVFQQAIEREKNKTILSSSPRLAEWLRNPENAAVAKDDLTGLSWWETTVGAGQNAFSRGVQRIPQSFNQFLANSAAERGQDQARGFGAILSDETAIRGKSGELVAWKPIVGPQDLLMAGSRFLTSRLSAMFGGDEQKAAAYYQQQVGAINQRIAEIPMSPVATVGRDNWNEASKVGDLGSFMTAIAKNPGSFMAFVGETAAESLPSLAAAIGVGAVTRSPGAAATFMGVNSAAIEKGTSPAEFFKEKGLDISTPEGAAGVVNDPALMREAIKRGNARAMVIGLMDGLSGGVAGKALVQSHVGNMILQSITQAAMGAAGEAGGQVAAGQQINLGDILMEGIAEFASAPIEVAGMGGARVMEGARKAKDAGDRKALFEALSGQAQSSILRGRMPEKFRQFVEAATADGPVENVYVPADQFVEYFQGIGVDPHALVDELEGVTRDDLDAALAGGGDLQIPTATYAAKIAGSEHDAFLMDNMRFDPDQFTAVEAADFNARAQDAMQEAHDLAEQVRLENEQLRSFEQEIYDNMVSRLRAAGRSTDVATTEAMLYPAFYRVMAERSGMTTEEFLQRYPLPEVSGAIPEGIQYKNVDELNRTLAAARSRKTVKDNRQTLLEFIDSHGGINDVGGELKARNAETVSRGKGKKSLKLSRKGIVAGARDLLGGVAGSGKKHGVDDVALAAIEAGFLADDPVADEYRAAMAEGREVPDIVRPLWAAIDRELSGDPQYSANEPVDPAVERNAGLDQVEEYLSSLGVTLQDDDATIRQAIEGAKQYGQDGRLSPVSTAFKAWFGDSKVVDADGKPLVVYHGARRSDRINKSGKFDKKRATSGPMSFFTDSPEIGSSYSTKKPDTSLDDEAHIAERFLVKPDGYRGKARRIDQMWWSISPEERARVAALAPRVFENDDGEIVLDEEGRTNGIGNYDHDLKEARGNHFAALAESWLHSGQLFDQEERFLDVLRVAGVTSSVEYVDPHMSAEGVFPVYLSIKNPLDTSAISADVIAALEKAAKGRRKPKYSVGKDQWDKTIQDPREWILRLRADAKDGTAHAWTSIPDWVTDALRVLGHDGIKDTGGKGGGDPHAVWIPFDEPQVKSVNNRGTFDPNDARLLFQSADPSPRAWMDEILNKGKERKKLAADLAASGKAVRLHHADGRYALAGPDMSKAGTFRLTRFDADGPVGHTEHPDLAAAVDQGLMMRFAPEGGPRAADGSAVSVERESPDTGWFNVFVNGEKAGSISIIGSGRGDFVEGARLEPAFQKRGVGMAAYAQIEAELGRSLVPSPLGLTNASTGLWQKKLGVMTREDRVAAVARAHEIGRMFGLRDEHLRERLDPVLTDESERTLYQSAELAQSGGPGPRGAIQFPAAGVGNGDTVIRLFQSADLSTTLHESGHYFLTVMQDMAARGETGAAADYAAVKDWWRANAGEVAKDAMRVMPDVAVTAEDVQAALDNGSSGDVMKDAAIDVGMQEQWARGFEAYLMEGNAPSAELQGAFEKFRAWLISVYRRLAGLNVTISDDIRAVFDRMIASDDEIAKANAETGDTGPLFATAEQMGLTPEQYAAFLKLRDQAQDDAKARLLRETMAPIKRQQEKWFKDERAAVRDEVEREVNASPMYRAIEWMGNRRWFGEGQPSEMPDIRLSKDVLVNRYGDGILKTLPRGKQTVYAIEGGLDPDDAAGWFGFGSGDEMVRAIEKAPPRKEAIEAETDRVMRDRHGDALHDGAIEAEALDAVHTDKRGLWIAAELKAVVEVAGTGKAMTVKEARATARQTIARMRVRDAMNANRFLAAERKAADEAARLGATLAREKIWLDNARRKIGTTARAALRGDGTVDAVAGAIDANNQKFETSVTSYTVPDREVVGKDGQARPVAGGARTATKLGYNDLVAKLVDAKRRQLLNHAFYSEARKVADEVEKAERFVAKLGKKSHRERIAGAGRREGANVDYLSAIDELLERYDFRKMSGTAEQRRGALNAFVAAMTAAGRENELAIPDDVLVKSARAPYKTLPVEEMRGVIDSLKNLEHMALRWDDLIDAQNKRKLDEVVTDILAAFEANVKKRPPGRVGTKGEALRNAGRQFLDLVLNATTLLREIDGFKDGGASYRNIKAPIDDAMVRLIARKEKAATDLAALYDVYSKDERRAMATRTHMPALGYALSKWERLAVALNMGNEGNFQRLTDPKVRGSLTEAQVQAVVASLDERDANFVQSVWDYIGSFRDDIGARERRATGVEPGWVEATPVVVGGKTLRGGYYPIKYDPRLSSLARDDETQEIAQSLQAGRFGKAQTRNGHLKDRAQSSGRDIELDMSVLHRHINQVVYDLELSEPVANAWRILQDTRLRNAFMDAGKQPDFDALETWLKDVAEGELRSADFIGRASRILKSNFTAAKLAFNLSTVMMQVSGLSQTMVVVGKKDLAHGVAASFRPGVIADIVAKSKYMATRQTTFNKDIYDFYSDPKTGPVASRWGEIKSEIIGPLSFWLMTKVQWHAVDVSSWLAGYHQGLRKFGNDEAKAIAHADDIVKRAQASGLFSDRSAIERGSVTRNARQNDVVRLFTTLGSYMFAKFNVAYERTGKAKRTIADEGVSAKSAQEALSWTLDMAFLFILEAVVTAAIKGQLPSADDGDDKDGWLKFLAKQTAFSVLGTMPLVRDVSSSLQGFDGGGAYGSAMKDAGGGVTGTWGVVSSFVKGDDVKKTDVKKIIAATGLATGLPATQINRFVDAEWRRHEGEDVSPLEYLLGKLKK